jgi:OFA family oxalate/formate antiporter-like MFS transporter
MVGGYGAGSAIFGPVATSLVGSVGWRATFQILGALFFVMGMIGAALLKNPPAGYQPPGWAPPKTGAAAQRSTRDYAPSEMVRTPTFVALWVAYCLGATAGLMVISQLVPFARAAGLTAAAATFAITIGAVGNAGGRILSGWMSDTLGRLSTLRVMVLLSAVAMPVWFGVRQELILFYLLAAVVYWCYGTQLSVFASTTADFYGTRNLGMNYGLLFSAWGVAGIIGPILGARVYDMFGDYRYAFYAAGALALVSFGSLALARPPHLPTPAAVPAAAAGAPSMGGAR